MLDSESQYTLDRRRSLGNRAIELASDGEDFDTAAKDIISDILTARFGPAGKLVDDGGRYKVELDRDAVENASALIDSALQSYFGDAEDYIEEEGEGEGETTPAERIKAEIEAKTIERHRIFLFGGGQEDAFDEDVTDEEILARSEALTPEENDSMYEGFDSEDYEAMDEINGVLGGLELALKLVEGK